MGVMDSGAAGLPQTKDTQEVSVRQVLQLLSARDPPDPPGGHVNQPPRGCSCQWNGRNTVHRCGDRQEAVTTFTRTNHSEAQTRYTLDACSSEGEKGRDESHVQYRPCKLKSTYSNDMHFRTTNTRTL